MILAFRLADIIQVPFGWLLDWLYRFTTGYGWALILFSIIVKLILMPTTIKSKRRRNMKTTSKSRTRQSRIFTKVKAFPWVAVVCGL